MLASSKKQITKSALSQNDEIMFYSSARMGDVACIKMRVIGGVSKFIIDTFIGGEFKSTGYDTLGAAKSKIGRCYHW